MPRSLAAAARAWLRPLPVMPSLAFALGCNDPPGVAAGVRPAAASAVAPALQPPTPGAVAPDEPATPPAPSAPPAQPEPARPDHEQADLDPDNDQVVGPPEPLEDCHARLERAGVSFHPAVLPLKSERVRGGGEVISCGAEQVVTYRSGPGKIRYDAPPLLTCRLALALARLEVIAQEQASRHLGKRIVRMQHGGTYNCRKMVRFDFVSEHSYANAIDIRRFQLEGGRMLDVRRHFGKLDQPPQTPEAEFLRSLARRAFDEHVFSVVLTPYWDALHADHFHFDVARYHVDGTGPR